jgi:hypothetical protein
MATTWSPGRITVSSRTISPKPLRITDTSFAVGKRDSDNARARRGRIGGDVQLDDLEALAAQLEQLHEPVLGHLAFNETEPARCRGQDLSDAEQVETGLG